MVVIREFRDADWAHVWPLLRIIFAAGDTYTFPPDIAETDARKAWVENPLATFVAEEEALIHGSRASVAAPGREVVGRLPGAFRHPERGFVHAFVMYKTLTA